MALKAERLYYDNPHMLEFEATIVGRVPLDEGRQGVVLDRTAFYPASGGQPHDTGTLEGIRVRDCFEDEAGRVVHVLDQLPDHDRVRGVIDGERRRDHMQQHSGQHVLSRAFLSLFNWPTVGFHMSEGYSTLDLKVGSIGREQIEQAEELANRTVEENLAVSIVYLSEQEVAAAGLRKETNRRGSIRVIDVEGFDRSACGGTHVQTTGEIGPIMVARSERVRKTTRLEFRCGAWARRHARQTQEALEHVSRIVSVPPMKVGPAVQGLRDQLRENSKLIEDLEGALTEAEASSFPLDVGLAVQVFEDRSQEAVRRLAQAICRSRPAVTLFAVAGDPVQLVFARAEDLSVDVGRVLKTCLEEFGGRGGGRGTIAQGGVPGLESPAPLLERAREEVLKQLEGGSPTTPGSSSQS